jgi:hypothetical protein
VGSRLAVRWPSNCVGCQRGVDRFVGVRAGAAVVDDAADRRQHRQAAGPAAEGVTAGDCRKPEGEVIPLFHRRSQ